MNRRRLLALGALSLAAGVAAVAGASARTVARAQEIPLAPAFSATQLNAYAGSDWLTTGGGLSDNRFSTLTQITTRNVRGLRTAWHVHLGIPKKKQLLASQEGSALAYGGILYLADGFDNVYAMDGATGRRLWKHTARLAVRAGLVVSRGVAIGEGRVYLGQGDGSVVALSQATGQQLWRTPLGLASEGYSFTSAPVYYNGMVMLGMSGGDSGARSFAVALDARTGLELWRWYVVPAPGEIGSGSWPPQSTEWMHGGGAIWIYPSIDPKANLLYVVTGNPVPWNGRGSGNDLWTDSIVALHIENGQLAWGFQTVHHDIWDWDVTNPPLIFDAMVKGRMRHGIAVASKTGWVYILDRYTGKPLIGIREKKVPQLSGAAATYANLSPTQPFPVGDAFVHQCPAKKYWRGKLAPDGKPYAVGCIFTPYAASPKGSFAAWLPGAAVDWPPSALNPMHDYAIVCATDGIGGGALGAIPKAQQKLIPGQLYVGVTFGSAPKGVPPNYGRVAAINVRTNRIAWSTKWPKPCYSGIATTAGNLVFAGESQPRRLVALNASTGKQVWHSAPLDAGPNAPSITYMANGRQYVAILVGGNNLFGTKAGDSVYAFALR